MSMSLGVGDARTLEAMLRRQLAWDARAKVRVVTTPKAIGVYSTPPMGVLAFIAVPASASADELPMDDTFTLKSLVDELHVVTQDGVPFDVGHLATTSIPVTAQAMSVAHLPPADGWQLPVQAIGGDLMVGVLAATEEYTRRAEGQSQARRQQIADEIWDRTAWAGLPLRVLHGAYRLGFLGDDSSKVAAATCGQWKRLSTVRGQVFARVGHGIPSLTVVRE